MAEHIIVVEFFQTFIDVHIEVFEHCRTVDVSEVVGVEILFAVAVERSHDDIVRERIYRFIGGFELSGHYPDFHTDADVHDAAVLFAGFQHIFVVLFKIKLERELRVRIARIVVIRHSKCFYALSCSTFQHHVCGNIAVV